MRIVSTSKFWSLSSVAAGLVGAMALSGAAQAQDLSDKAVEAYMDYAWSFTTDKYTTPQGRTIYTDLSKRDSVTVPKDIARDIIKTAQNTAYAQVCELFDEERNNYVSMMRRQIQSGKWSEQQQLYIHQLHTTTVMILLGKVKVTERDGKKEAVIEEGKSKLANCTPEQKVKVKETIDKYVKDGPSLADPNPLTLLPPVPGAPKPAPVAATVAPAAAPKK